MMSRTRRRAQHFAARALVSAPHRVNSVLARGGAWLERTSRDAMNGAARPPAPAAPVSPPAPQGRARFVTTRPLQLPEGLSDAELRKVYSTWAIDGEPRGHMDAYVADSFYRFVHTYSLASALTGRGLELGANPYFTTYLFDEHSGLDMELANYFDGASPTVSQRLEYVGADGVATVKQYESAQFNIEDDRFPYEDASFDVVLFCEILEHLLMNPVAVLREISRTLKMGGSMVLTTPNVCRLSNVVRMVEGVSIYDPYSGYGPYGRHNREYTLDELVTLLEFVGFQVVESFTADGHDDLLISDEQIDRVAPLLEHRPAQLGQYLFVRAEKVAESREGLPDHLYRSWPPGDIVPSKTIDEDR